jgi:hypothetical protein
MANDCYLINDETRGLGQRFASVGARQKNSRFAERNLGAAKRTTRLSFHRRGPQLRLFVRGGGVEEDRTGQSLKYDTVSSFVKVGTASPRTTAPARLPRRSFAYIFFE